LAKDRILNVGVLSPPGGLLAYQGKALTLLQSTEGVRVSFCFQLCLPMEPRTRPEKPNFRKVIRGFLTERFLEKTEWEVRVAAPVLPTLPFQARREGRFSVLLRRESEELLNNLQLDVLVNFTNHILRGPILSLPKYGVWSYHHGDPLEFRGYPPGFWEIYHGASSTGAILQKLEHRLDDGVVLRKATFPTIHHSYYRQRQTLFSVSIPWLAEVAREILSGNAPSMEKTEAQAVGPIYTRATDAEFLKFLALLLRNKIRRLMGQ